MYVDVIQVHRYPAFKCEFVRRLPQSNVVVKFVKSVPDVRKLTKCNGQKKMYVRCQWCLQGDHYLFKYKDWESCTPNMLKNEVRRLARDLELWCKTNSYNLEV